MQSVSADGPSVPQQLLGAQPVDIGALEPLKTDSALEAVWWDVANQALSPMLAGVATKKAAQPQDELPPARQPAGQKRRNKKAKQRA